MSLSAVRITPGNHGKACMARSLSTQSRHSDMFNLCCTEVFLACTTHALTHESEEVMGLLLGDIQVRANLPIQTCVYAHKT